MGATLTVAGGNPRPPALNDSPEIVSNFTRPTSRKITYNNFEISLMVFMSNITTNHAITYTNSAFKQLRPGG